MNTDIRNKLDSDKKRFELYTTVLRFLAFKITDNLKRIYLDINDSSYEMILTAFYKNDPTELELELLDDIETNSSAHIPDYSVHAKPRLTKEFIEGENHDFIIFSVYEKMC